MSPTFRPHPGVWRHRVFGDEVAAGSGRYVFRHGKVAHGSAVEHVSAPAGRYHGLSPFTGLRFFVSFGRTQVQDVSLFGNLDCSNNSAIADTLIVPAATIHTDGSFATSRRDTGIRNGHPTDFTYTFRGNFHSIGPDHSGRAAGTMRESFTFTDTDVTCTSDTQAWAAPRTS